MEEDDTLNDDDAVTNHEIAAHERLKTIVKKEERIQKKRDERAQRRMRKMRKKKDAAPGLRASRFRIASKKREEEAVKNQSDTDRIKKWSAYKRFNPFAEREARMEERKKMLKGDENWFEMNMILSKFGHVGHVSMTNKKNKHININGNRGPWKRPDIDVARDHAAKWRMLNGDADIKRTNVSEFDVWESTSLSLWFGVECGQTRSSKVYLDGE